LGTLKLSASVLLLILALRLILVLRPALMSRLVRGLAQAFVLEKAMRFQSRPKKLVRPALRANFLLAGTAWGLVSET
jgi:hypothetical protein